MSLGTRINGFGFRSPDSDAFKSEFSYDAEFRDSTVSNGDPYAAEFTILQGDMKILEPERGTPGGYTFDFADAEAVGVNPNLSAQKVSIFPLRRDLKNVFGNVAEVLLF